MFDNMPTTVKNVCLTYITCYDQLTVILEAKIRTRPNVTLHYRGGFDGVLEGSILLGYDAASLGNRFPTFRKNVVP
jgi:hypothetical protein